MQCIRAVGIRCYGWLRESASATEREKSMTKWDERVTAHGAIPTLSELHQLLSDVEPDDSEDAEDLARLRDILSYAQSVSDQADPQLITPEMLDAVESAAKNVLIEVKAYQAQPDGLRLTDGNTEADLLVRAISQWPRPITGKDLEGLREKAVSYRASIGQLIRRLETEVSGIETRVGEITSAQESLRPQIDGELQTTRTSAEQQIADLQAAVDQQKGRLDQAIAEFQQQFSAAESRRSARFESNAQDQQAKSVEIVQALQEQADAALQEFMERGETALSELRTKAEEARRLAVTLGAIGVSGGHGQYARQQKRTADGWRYVSVSALLIVAIAAIVIVLSLPDGGIDWERFVGKFLISAPLIALAGYAASQSSKHRRAEREARKVDLDLAALELYLELFPDDKKNEIKEKIGLLVFGQPLPPDSGDHEAIGANQLWDFITKHMPK